jgi:hypothetical protein
MIIPEYYCELVSCPAHCDIVFPWGSRHENGALNVPRGGSRWCEGEWRGFGRSSGNWKRQQWRLQLGKFRRGRTGSSLATPVATGPSR